MFNLSTKNTTVMGIVMILTAIASAAAAIFDGDLETTIDYPATIAAITGGIALIRVKVVPPPEG